jgi:hypothetical protein
MDYHVLTFTKNINLDRLILIKFIELNKDIKKTTTTTTTTKTTTTKKQNKNNKAKQNKADKQTSK